MFIQMESSVEPLAAKVANEGLLILLAMASTMLFEIALRRANVTTDVAFAIGRRLNAMMNETDVRE